MLKKVLKKNRSAAPPPHRRLLPDGFPRTLLHREPPRPLSVFPWPAPPRCSALTRTSFVREPVSCCISRSRLCNKQPPQNAVTPSNNALAASLGRSGAGLPWARFVCRQLAGTFAGWMLEGGRLRAAVAHCGWGHLGPPPRGLSSRLAGAHHVMMSGFQGPPRGRASQASAGVTFANVHWPKQVTWLSSASRGEEINSAPGWEESLWPRLLRHPAPRPAPAPRREELPALLGAP